MVIEGTLCRCQDDSQVDIKYCGPMVTNGEVEICQPISTMLAGSDQALTNATNFTRVLNRILDKTLFTPAKTV